MGKQQQQEDLPPGVGRVPKWWMEETPHYVLDLEADNARRLAEEQMAFYYAQMAAADDAGYLDANGNPILGPDGKPIGGWGGPNGWAGRGAGNDGGGFGPEGGPLGKNFVPGQVTPESLKLLGITNSHPDYASFLSGAKFPPGYWEKLMELGYSTGPGFSANNLAQTDYGRYGRQAESPKFQPVWAKKKLKSTAHGSMIRQGQYEGMETPEKRRMRRVQDSTESNPVTGISALNLDGDDNSSSAQPTPAASSQQQPQQQPPAATTSQNGEQPVMKRLVRKVRKVRRKKRDHGADGGGSKQQKEQQQQQHKVVSAPAAPAPAPVHTPASPPPPVAPQPTKPEPHQEPLSYEKYSQKEHHFHTPTVAATTPPPAPPAPRAAPPAPKPVAVVASPPPSPPRQQHNHHHHDEHSEGYEFEEEEIIEEEIIEDDEYEEIIEDEEYTDGYYEELLSPSAGDTGGGGGDSDINDLQAILAAKQAELARLQAQLM